MAEQNNKAGIDILLQTLAENPNLWETRKKTAELLYEEKEYLQAANIIWNAPEIPATDIDVAFVLKMISRVKPNRSIRLIYEIVRRNHNKPHKNLAVAQALNNIGMYMEAARFYGAALAVDSSLFDLGFERQSLWLDDTGKLLEEWKKSDQESKPPLDVGQQNLSGGTISTDLLSRGTEDDPNQQQPQQPAPVADQPANPLLRSNPSPQPTATQPLMTNQGSMQTPVRQATNPLLRANPSTPPLPAVTQPLMHNSTLSQPMTAAARQGTNPLLKANPSVSQMPAPTASQPLMSNPVATQPLIPAPAPAAPATPARPATNPLLRAGNAAPPKQMATQPLMPNPVATQPLMVNPVAGTGAATPPLPAAPPTPMTPPMDQPLQYAPLPQNQPPAQPAATPPEKPKFKLS